jgi:hypothetical protein
LPRGAYDDRTVRPIASRIENPDDRQLLHVEAGVLGISKPTAKAASAQLSP